MHSRLLFFLIGAAGAYAQQAPVSLDELIRMAWTNDPTAAALALVPELARGREVQAGVRPNPDLELSASVPFKDDSEWQVGIGVRQRLPNRERLELARAYARLGAESAALQLRERQRLLAGEVRRLVYDLAVHEARVSAAMRSRDFQRDLIGAVEARRAAGEVADAEWAPLQLEQQRADHAVAWAEAEAAGARERLRRRLRLPADVPLAPALDLRAVLDRDLPDPFELPAERAPALSLAELGVRQAEAAVALARGESRGEWTVGAGLDFQRRANDATGRLENEPSVRIGASVPWSREVPNRGDILEKEAAVRIAEAERAALGDELTAALASAASAVRAARPVVHHYQSLLGSAAAQPEKLAAAYARGEVSGLQVVMARQQHLAIESDFLAAASRYAALLAEAETAAGVMPAQP